MKRIRAPEPLLNAVEETRHVMGIGSWLSRR